MPVDNYLVYYIPGREAIIVNVIRVLYGGMDVNRELEPNGGCSKRIDTSDTISAVPFCVI